MLEVFSKIPIKQTTKNVFYVRKMYPIFRNIDQSCP